MADTATEEKVDAGELLLDDPDALLEEAEEIEAPPGDGEPPAVEDTDVPPPPDKGDGGDDGRGDGDAEGPQPPQPGITKTVLVGLILVLLAQLGFAYLLIMDFRVRQQYSYAVFLHDLALYGLPLDEEKHGFSGSRELEEPQGSDPEALERRYRDRKGTIPLKERFATPPDLIAPRITADQIGPETIKSLFPSEPPGKPTLQAEVDYVKGKIPSVIDAAADEVAQKAEGEAAKRQVLAKLLYSLPHTTPQIAALKEALPGVKADELDALIAEAARRKMIFDILAPLEEYSPSDSESYITPLLVALNETKDKDKKLTVERFLVPPDKVKDTLIKRIASAVEPATWDGMKQTTSEKRRNVAFLLYTLSSVEKPGQVKVKPKEDEPPPALDTLYPAERGETAVGTLEFGRAGDIYAIALNLMQRKQLTFLEMDRGQGVYTFDFRIHEPEKFVPLLTNLFKSLEIAVPDEKKFEKDALELFTDQRGKIKDGNQLLTELKGLMVKNNIVIVEEDLDAKIKANVKEAAFHREVLRLLDPREIGFIGDHFEAVRRLRDLVRRIEDQERRLLEVTKQEKELQSQLAVASAGEKQAINELLTARSETKKLADSLAYLQQQLFLAQVELSDAAQRNQVMEQRIRLLEKIKGGKGTP